MPKFRIVFAENEPWRPPMHELFPGIIPQNDTRRASGKCMLVCELECTGSDLEKMLQSMPPGQRSLVQSPEEIIAYLLGKRYARWKFRLHSVCAIPSEQLPDLQKKNLQGAADGTRQCYCSNHRPGNPQISDPWARGY